MLDRGWDTKKERVARQAIGQGMEEASRDTMEALLLHLESKPTTPLDLRDYEWVHVGWNAAGKAGELRVDGVVVRAMESGLIETWTPLGQATMPWWCGWRTDQQLSVMCVGAT